LKIGVSVRHIFKPISYLEIQLLSGVSGGYISGLLNSVLYDIVNIIHYVSCYEIEFRHQSNPGNE
ncbi:hypothetical protein, partial [Enterobacter hormaechei]|uniref:hypothetical protein n=1 Tax=Enterobacter hormaechei TaxID=158836 RepID=UPI003D6DF212